MNIEKNIAIKAMCLFHNNGRILVAKGLEKINNQKFYRLIGGSINFSETSEVGIRREIKEELRSEVENLKLIDIIENLFTYEGSKGHEIVFLYSGDLARKDLYRGIGDAPHLI